MPLKSQLCCALTLLGTAAAFGQSYNIQTVAGTTRLKNGAPAINTPLNYPWGVAEDGAGNVYISDMLDAQILQVDTSGNIHVLAGTGVAGFSGDGGAAINAEFNEPRGLCLDGKGDLFIDDWGNSVVRELNLSTGVIKTVAGNGSIDWSGDGGPALQAGMDPADIAVDSAGNLYIADYLNNRIRKVSAATQIIQTIAGQNISGDAGDGGPAVKAVLNGPLGVSINSQGIVYFADYYNNYVRQINQTTGVIDAFAGNGNFGLATGGKALTSPMFIPFGTAVEPNGNVLILEVNYIQRVTLPAGTISTVAGSMNFGYGGDGGPVSGATFSFPLAMSTSPNSDILLSDTGNFRVRRIRSGNIITVAGTTIANNVPATSTYLNLPSGVAGMGQGNFVIADTGDSQVRKVMNGTITVAAGNGVAGNDPGELNFPGGVAVDARGTIYIADTVNNRVLRLAQSGTPAVVAGNGNYAYKGDNGYAPSASLAGPTSVVLDQAGNLFIADADNCAIRKVDTNQNITTLVGDGTCASTGNNGPAANAEVEPYSLALDNSGNLYFAEPSANRIRKLNLNTMIVTPVSGVGSAGYSGDGGDAATAQLNNPMGVAVDANGNVFIADEANEVVREIIGTTIWTVAGTGPAQFSFNLESGPALAVSIDPGAINISPDGSIFIADGFNDRIRELTPTIASALSSSTGKVLSGVPGSQLAVSVTVTDSSGNPVGNATVNFSVTQGSAQLSASSVQTNGNGVAIVLVTLGSAGSVQITATVSGLTPVVISLTSAGPAINAGGVTGAALSSPPVTSLAVGGIATVFGSAFGGGATFQSVGSSDLVNGAVPTNFKGICVDVSGTRAPIFGVSNTQVNFQVPTVSGKSVLVRVLTNCGTTSEVATVGVSAPLAAAAPEFFYFATNSNGHNPVAAADAQTDSGIAASSLFPGSGFAPAYPGEYVTVYGTGFGATNPSVSPGIFASVLTQVTGAVQVMLNGQPLPSADILYTGFTPSSPGLYQVDFQVPQGTPNGDLPLVISIGGIQSPEGAYLTVQAPAQ